MSSARRPRKPRASRNPAARSQRSRSVPAPAAAGRSGATRAAAPRATAAGARPPGSSRTAAGTGTVARPDGAASLTVGEAVADFALPATGGAPWRLSEARGRKLVIYFYPRDNTPGCTLEGRDFAALAPRFAAIGATIVGISRDSLASHEKFREQMSFPFALLSDTDETVCRQFDVIRLKNLYGRTFPGVERSTFLLDARGVLRAAWRKVKVNGHARAVLAAAEEL